MTQVEKNKDKRSCWTYICIAHSIRCLSDRSFSFFLPLYLSKQQCHARSGSGINSRSRASLRPTAALTFAQNLSVVLLSTTVAKLFRKNSILTRCPTSSRLSSSPRTFISPANTNVNTNVNSNQGKNANSLLRNFILATILENVAVVLLGLFIHAFLSNNGGLNNDERGATGAATANNNNNNNNNNNSSACDDPFSSNYFCMAVFCGCIDAILSSLLSMVISKEWVASLFYNINSHDETIDDESKQSKNDLAKANAFLSQIDLIIGTICPLLVSYLISLYGYHSMLMISVVQHLGGAIIIIYCIRKVLWLQPSLAEPTTTRNLHHEKGIQIATKNDDPKSNVIQTTQKLHQDLHSFPKTFIVLPLPSKLISIGYIMLYFTILLPGPMLNAWMSSMHHQTIPIMTDQRIAYFGSMSQFCGAISTFITPLIVSNTKSLYKASAVTQWMQSTFIIYGFICFYRLHSLHTTSSSSANINNQNIIDDIENHNRAAAARVLLGHFLISIGLSRIGLWSFDLVERQVIQESVPRMHQTLFFNGEKSMTQLLSLGMMALCYIYPDPDSFIVLVTYSVVAICSCSVLILLVQCIPFKKAKIRRD